MRTVYLAVLLLVSAPALASHTETHATGWFEYVWDEDDQAVLHCNAFGTVSLGAGLWIHDRPGHGHQPLVWLLHEDHGGTWIYQETNGIDGIQIGGTAPLGGSGSAIDYFDPFADECPNSDTLMY